MSAKPLYKILFLAFIASCGAAAAAAAAHDPISSGSVTESTPPGRLFVRLLTKETKYLVVEEVDNDGRSEMKQMALPDYNDSEEKREDEERRREQRMEFVSVGMAAGVVPRRLRDREGNGAQWTKDSGGRC